MTSHYQLTSTFFLCLMIYFLEMYPRSNVERIVDLPPDAILLLVESLSTLTELVNRDFPSFFMESIGRPIVLFGLRGARPRIDIFVRLNQEFFSLFDQKLFLGDQGETLFLMMMCSSALYIHMSMFPFTRLCMLLPFSF